MSFRAHLPLCLIIIFATLLGACSGPSKEELRRMQLLEAQRAELAAQQAQREAEQRRLRVSERTSQAQQALALTPTISEQQIKQIFSENADADLSSNSTYFHTFNLQPAKYNYGKNKQSFTIVGMRNLPDSEVYSPLFPDESALYQPGQKAKSVLEFALSEETELNRLGQPVLKEKGKRWVAATLNFKKSTILKTENNDWQWEAGLFEDLSWLAAPETTYPHTADRDLRVQIGFRLCLRKDRCYLESRYRQHPTQAVRAEVMSVTVFNQKSREVLSQFINDKE